MKKLVMYVVGFALVLSLSACGSKNTTDNAAATMAPASETAAPASGDVKEVTITAINYEFDKKEYKFAAGDTVKFTLVNKDGEHGVSIPELGVDLNKDHPTSDAIVMKAGTYTMRCSVMCGSGHSSMASNVIVE